MRLGRHWRRVAGAIALGLWCGSAFAGPGAWTTSGPRAKSLKGLVGNPNDPNVLYAGAFGSGVYKSTDGGLTWRQHRSGLRNSFVRCLAIDAARPETLYAGTNDGLYRSVDGDSTWILLLDAEALVTPTSVRAVAIDRSHPATLYAGTFDDGIFKSIDGGAHWTPINLGLTNTSIRSIAIHPVSSDTVLAGTGTSGGVFRSSDGGLSWTQAGDTAASVSAAEQVVYDPRQPTRVYVATGSHGVIVSRDGGVTWKRLARGLTSFVTRSLAVVDTVRYVGTDSSGVFFATLSDTLWHAASGGLTNLHADALLARTRTDVWVGTDGSGAFHSLDSGGTWNAVDGGLLDTDVIALGISNDHADVYCGAGLGDQFWSSASEGAAWARTDLPAQHGSVEGIADDAGAPAVVYQAITDVGVLRSADRGVTWTNPDLAATLVRPLAALVSDPARPGVLYVGSRDGVFKSATAGSSWSLASSGLPANAHVKSLALDPLHPDTLIAGTDSLGVFVSVNGAASWSAAGAGIPGVYVHDVRCDPAGPGVVYAATDAGVFRSTNLGATWSSRNAGLPATASVRAVAGDPAHPNLWFAGVRGAGVFQSNNAGGTWTALTEGLGSLNVNTLAVDAAHATLYAGTEAGAYQFTGYATTGVTPAAGPPAEGALTGRPNPFRDAVRIQVPGGPGGRVSVDVFDPGGRRVRRLLRGANIAGPTGILWDGRDDHGAKLPGGIYIVRWSAQDRATGRSVRLVLLR